MADTLAHRLTEVKAVKVCDTLTDLKATYAVVTLAPTLVDKLHEG